MKKQAIIISVVVVCLALMPVVAYSLPVSGSGMSGGSFAGSIDIGYSYDRLSTATPWLLISLTNSSANDTLFIAGYALPGGSMSEIGLVRSGDTWTGRQPLFTADRGVSVESIISGFVVLFSDAEGRLIDKAPVAVAEPSTMILLGFGFLAIGLGMRKRTK
jgi:hypothetical protein